MSREEAIKKVILGETFGYKFPIELIFSDIQMKLEDSICEAVQNVGIIVDKGELIKALEYDREQYKKGYDDALKRYGECNQCRYYEGVHNVQGHAPCRFWNIGGVMYDDYCSRFEKEGEAE